MMIFTKYNDTASRYFWWLIHNIDTGMTYKLQLDTESKEIQLTFGTATLNKNAALDFWAQLASQWDNDPYRKFISDSVRKCRAKDVYDMTEDEKRAAYNVAADRGLWK